MAGSVSIIHPPLSSSHSKIIFYLPNNILSLQPSRHCPLFLLSRKQSSKVTYYLAFSSLFSHVSCHFSVSLACSSFFSSFHCVICSLVSNLSDYMLLWATSFTAMPPMSKSNNSKIELIIFLPNLFLRLLFFIFWLIASIAHQVPKLETLDSFGASFSFFPLTVPQSNATQQSLYPYPPPYIFAFYKVLSSPQSILNHPIFATLPCVIILVQAWSPLNSCGYPS